MLQVTAGVGLAILAQLCWGVDTDLPIWRMFAGWALMVTAVICWNQTTFGTSRRCSDHGVA
jgi:hypothetical protein